MLTGLGAGALLAGLAFAGALVDGFGGGGPGLVLGVCLVAGSLLAAALVVPERVRIVLPMPPLAYAVAAAVAGLIGDPGQVSGGVGLAAAAGRWLSEGFVAMATATLLVVALAVVRATSTRAR
ncbi:hypothetical protein DZF91_27455 [Actinomadura logoneensis]|uniref:DUF6542 domain-containing protein n=1 Tax=Actinomadura logoneensis TaxID=2293572 RepID=A0A372JEN9_9ACTN|nr:DUF6542 domain-containing protein [Actinomadura logoneensis]RFU38481.1 hypothetical protein DZF91_27455 [Actinomadura logoneensis]